MAKLITIDKTVCTAEQWVAIQKGYSFLVATSYKDVTPELIEGYMVDCLKHKVRKREEIAAKAAISFTEIPTSK